MTNEAFDLGDPVRKAKPKNWGHQVAVRFSPEDLDNLDELVARAVKRNETSLSPQQHTMQPSRSSVLVGLVVDAWMRLKGAARPRQVDLEEMIAEKRNQALQPVVDKLELSLKRLNKKTKAPRGAGKRPRSGPRKRRQPTPKRKRQIAAAHKRFAAKKRKGARR